MKYLQKQNWTWVAGGFALIALPLGIALNSALNDNSQEFNIDRQSIEKEFSRSALQIQRKISRSFEEIESQIKSGEFKENKNWAYYSEVGLGADRIETLKKSKKNKSVPEIQAKFFENFFLTAVQKRFTTRQLIQSKRLFFLVPKYVGTSRKSRHDWHVFAFLDESDPKFRTAKIIALKPYWAQRHFEANQKNRFQRSYLLHRSGKILAHSKPSYIGAKIDRNYLGKNANPVQEKKSRIDHFPVIEAEQEIGKFPIRLIVESIDSARLQGSSLKPTDEQKVSLFGLSLILFGIFSIGLLFRFRKRIPIKAFKKPKTPESPTGAEVAGIPVTIVNDQLVIGKNRPRIQTKLEIKNDLRFPKQDNEAIRITSQFELNARRIVDPRILASSLTQTTSQLCESPALFFRFNSSINVAFLETDAGFKPEESIEEFSFPIHKGAIQRIFDCTKRGKLASLAQYEPLSKPMIEQLGVAVFEAWAIPRVTQKQTIELLGILVILHSGVLSSTRRDLLVRLMRSMAIHHQADVNDSHQEKNLTK